MLVVMTPLSALNCKVGLRPLQLSAIRAVGTRWAAVAGEEEEAHLGGERAHTRAEQ